MSDNFHRAHAFTAHWEGGFSDHPADTGGLTAYGASLKFVQGIAATGCSASASVCPSTRPPCVP